jgi:hypothetical protein
MKRITILALVAVFALAPAAAFADSGTAGVNSAADAVYDGPGILGDEPGDAGTKNVSDEGTPTGTNVTSLPFTGYAAGVVLLLGAGMLVVGTVGRRFTRRQQ